MKFSLYNLNFVLDSSKPLLLTDLFFLDVVTETDLTREETSYGRRVTLGKEAIC